MTEAYISLPAVRIALPSADATARLAEWLAPQLIAGDTILIEGSIGAGKTHFCRNVIHARLRAEDRIEDVPSPTYTLIQTYELEDVDIWHADLYRLTSIDDLTELGMEDALATAICLVEWPDRLGRDRPANALSLKLATGPTDDGREAQFTATDGRWAPVLAALANWRAGAS